MTLETRPQSKGSSEGTVTLTLMGGLSIRTLTYTAPKKGVIDGLKWERKRFERGLNDLLDARHGSVSDFEIRKPPSLRGGEELFREDVSSGKQYLNRFSDIARIQRRDFGLKNKRRFAGARDEKMQLTLRFLDCDGRRVDGRCRSTRHSGAPVEPPRQ